MKNTFFLLLLLSSSLFAQDLPADLGKGRIRTKDGTKITFAEFKFGMENHQYKTTKTSSLKDIAAENVYAVEKQTGTEAGKWALWLGLSGLAGSLLGVAQGNAQAKSQGLESNNSASVGIVVGLTALSAGIGAAIGANQKNYENVYTNPEYGSNQKANSFQLGLTCSAQSGYGLGLTMRFN